MGEGLEHARPAEPRPSHRATVWGHGEKQRTWPPMVSWGRKVLCALKGALEVAAVKSSGEDAARRGHSGRRKGPPGWCGRRTRPGLWGQQRAKSQARYRSQSGGGLRAEAMPPSTAVRRCVGSLREGAKGRGEVGGGPPASCTDRATADASTSRCSLRPGTAHRPPAPSRGLTSPWEIRYIVPKVLLRKLRLGD